MLTRENKLEIIGTIESINLVPGSNDQGNYIRGNLVVKVSSPKMMNIPLNFYASELTKDNKPRKLYNDLKSLHLGQRVSITGSIGDNKFWDATRGQLARGKRLNIVFLNKVGASDVDKANFIYSGFVKETLKENLNTEGKLLGYSIKIGQANYNGTRAEVISFNIDPNNRQAINYMEAEYTSGKTVKISGELDYDIITETKTEEVAFGAPIVKTYQRNISNLIITGGQKVEEGIYEKPDIEKLLAADLEDDRRVEAEAKVNEKAGGTTNKSQSSASAHSSLL